ncbi:multidrug resistance-associated ABC transporter [Laetiporus sulphureus 93-53]|uniref:Multidrug resistance-associated ABC transporter n=1 Tax=Laetiporus sulphureus 93-53 TaxID=1314785 RepID=A0A165BHG5_9APHY|nr:multidrug resistance-associated ABC transporter [Laetiporus sulphureus 93-53]KZT01063.1 multidrug resistance-associated ABC transporter [Laetiporus sulphureus 93-53]
MPPYQLPVAITLAGAAACSLIVFLIFRPKGGKIQLPISEEVPERDPFDVTKPEDRIDGYPVNEEAFWYRMRLRKLAISIFLGSILAIQSVCLGWSAIDDDRSQALIHALHVAFALYLLIIAGRSVRKQDGSHAVYIVHLSALTFVATALFFTTAILPSSRLAHTGSSDVSAVPLGLFYATFTLYAISLVIAATTPCGPPLHFPPEQIYSEKTIMKVSTQYADNVCGIRGASMWDTLLFSYTTKVVMLGNTSESLEIADLPIVPADMRATTLFATMRAAMRAYKLRVGSWKPKPGSGWELLYRLVRVNARMIMAVVVLAAVAAVLFYTPAFFLRNVVYYLEVDPDRTNRGWGWVYCTGLFVSNAITHLITGQLWSLSTTTLQVRLKVQLNSILFAKTLVRKDVASSSGPAAASDGATSSAASGDGKSKEKEEDDFSSKAQIMTLMTTDVDRVSEFAWHLFTLIDSPVEIVIGTLFLYNLLGISCFIGLAVTCLFLPLNHFAGKVVVGAQDNLMKARDERVSLMNEILGGIRMLKFMAWERSFEERVMKIRAKELKYQRLNYHIEVLFNAIWNSTPIVVTLVSFWHFAVVRQQVLTPSIAFTSISIFNEMKFALNALPETFINMLQSLVSMRRIEKYLLGQEVAKVEPLDGQPHPIILQNATITWPQDRVHGASAIPSVASTPQQKFTLLDLSLNFPLGELTLICGRLGSGKSLLLLSLLGEADVLAGQVISPRTPPDTISSFAGVVVPEEEWVVEGVCAYVPQSAWLRNASIKDNILFDLPYVEERYRKTLQVCALESDLKILEDGDMSEIGEKGVNLSGGQKARVSLARAVYSRASVLLLDDVLSAVDAHTARHLYHECLKGDLMTGRTVILVSHHVQLCAPGAEYVVALDNGRVQYQGDVDGFRSSGVMSTLVQSGVADKEDDKEETAVETVEELVPVQEYSTEITEDGSETTSTAAGTEADVKAGPKKVPRKLIEEEKRAVGHIGKDVWTAYLGACGEWGFWIVFVAALLLAALSPVAENGWLRIWTGSSTDTGEPKSAMFYITVYAAITCIGVVLTTLRWFVVYYGGIHASTVLHKRLLEGVLFANIRFHDTISRGRLLNRFGKDFEGVDSSLPDNFGRSVVYCFSVTTTFITITYVGGFPFLLAAVLFGTLYYSIGKVYGQTSRDMRRLDSVTRSPLYSIYGETIAGVTVLRAFGASTKFMRDMLRCVDTNANPYYWMWGVNRWLSARFNLLSSAVVGVTAFIAILTPSINASLAGFALAFASTVLNDLLFLVRRFVGLEQSMVAVERIKEFSELPREPPEFIEPRPPAAWPEKGEIVCENLVIRYAPDLPNVLHNLTFRIEPGEKVGVLGRTGSGKSTLALSFFRFVEPTEGRILIDGLDISKMGLTDLRGKLTIIPQDPTILSGTLRSTLDVFNEYEDAEIYEALRRVHLIPAGDRSDEDLETVNANVFRNLDSPVSEGGENFSTGEKQLLCMARAILKRTKVLLMDEATASVDYATDELIGKTIRHEFAESTILTIAHRLRTVIDYDRVMLLDQGRIAEFDKPHVLLADPTSKFHALCKATGKNEFTMLKKMAGVP